MRRVGVLILLALAVATGVSGIALAEHAADGTPGAVWDSSDSTAADSELNPISDVLQEDEDEDEEEEREDEDEHEADEEGEEGREDKDEDEEKEREDDEGDEEDDEDEKEAEHEEEGEGDEEEREDEDEHEEEEGGGRGNNEPNGHSHNNGQNGDNGRNENNGNGNNGRNGNNGNGQQGAAGQDDRGDDRAPGRADKESEGGNGEEEVGETEDDESEGGDGEEEVGETEDDETEGSDGNDENGEVADETSEQDETSGDAGEDDGNGAGGAEDSDGDGQDDGGMPDSLPSSLNRSASATATTPSGEATFSVPTATLGRTSMTTGESVRIRLRVENTGEREGSYEVVLRVDGARIATESVTVGPGGTETIVFNYQVDDPGEYEIAVGEQSLGTLTVTAPDADAAVTTPDNGSVDVSGTEAVEVVEATTADDWVREGYETTVRATVVNTANRTVTRALTVTVDGQPVANRSVTLQPGERDEVTIAFDAVDGAVAVEGVDAGKIAVGERFGGAETQTDRTTQGTDLWAEFGLAVFLGVLISVGALGLGKE